MDTLLRSFIFKELVVTSTIKGLNHKLREERWSDYTSKLEVAVLGLLWCSGSQDSKARYLAALANPSGSDTITHQSGEMRFIFKKLFYYSIDMAAKYTQVKAQMEHAGKSDFRQRLGKHQERGNQRRDSSSNSDDDKRNGSLGRQ